MLLLQYRPIKNIVNKDNKYAIDYILDINILRLYIIHRTRGEKPKTDTYPLVPNTIFKTLITSDILLYSKEDTDIDVRHIYPFDYLNQKEKIATILNTYDILLKKQNIKSTFLKDSCIYSVLYSMYEYIKLHSRRKNPKKSEIADREKLLINAVKFIFPEIEIEK